MARRSTDRHGPSGAPSRHDSPVGKRTQRHPVLAMRFLFAPEACGTPLPKTTPRSRSSSDDPGWKVRITTIGDGARPAANLSDSLPAIKGSRTPTDAGLPACLAASAHPAGRARLSAFHGGSALGTHASQGAASDQVSRNWPQDGGGLPPAPTPVSASTSHAGTPVIVPADLMSDTARVQRGRTLCARAPHPAPASRSHRLTSL